MPELGETLSLCLDVVRYRVPHGITVSSQAHEVFRCGVFDIAKRLTRETSIKSAELALLLA